MARKKASHPPPPSPRKLRNVIEAGMMNIENIPRDMDMDFDPTKWKLFNHPNDLSDILKTMENNFENPKWESIDSAILNGDGWYLWHPSEEQVNDYLVWLSEEQVKSGDHSQSSWMTLVSNLQQAITAKTTYKKYTIDNLIVQQVHQNHNWGHQSDFSYTLILPTDENKMWIPISKIDNVAINFKRFPKVLLEGA